MEANGDVKVDAVLDFEVTKSYMINVKATDGGHPALSATSKVVITVMDSNDNSPRFTGTPYNCVVLENSPSQSPVCYVAATDADSGSNAKIAFTIGAGGGEECPFAVEPVST